MPFIAEPAWLAEARKYIDVAEIKGPKSNDLIARWLVGLSAWWSDDETPWCGVFVANCIKAAGLPLPKFWMRAKAWADWGSKLSSPFLGCVVVFERVGGGHVGFVVGRAANGNLMVLGGNQGDKVCIRPFELSRVVGYYWPPGLSLPNPEPLPMLDASGLAISTNEA